MSDRGFRYDHLTVADDEHLEAVRERIYACPCGSGAWVSIQTGEVYRGNGGNEREQWWLQSRGPWAKVEKDEGFDTEARMRRAHYKSLEDLRRKVAEVIGVDYD